MAPRFLRQSALIRATGLNLEGLNAGGFMEPKPNQHQSVDTILILQEFAYRTPSPDSEPPEHPESGASGSPETEGDAEIVLEKPKAHELKSKIPGRQ